MNPRQRRGVVVLVLAMIAGLATFVAVFRYVDLVNRQVGPIVNAVVAVRTVAPWEPLTADALALEPVPAQWMPDTAIRTIDEIVGLVAPTGLLAGSTVQEGMVVSPPALAEGEREFAITVDRESGVAGQLAPESIVDVVAAFEETEGRAAETRAIVVNARVLTVDGLGTGDDPLPKPEADDVPEQGGIPEAQTVTLSLTSKEALDAAFAQSFSKRVRLVLVPPGTPSDLVPGERVATLPGDPAPPEGEQP